MKTHFQTCARCGSSHPSDVADGLCPGCLLSRHANPLAGPPVGEQPGDCVGSYELCERIAEGGMGSVWRARQLHPVERDVAVKIIRLGMSTREVVARFELERRTLARMDHPGIATVHEAGATPEGRPYFAMEFVDGQPVTRYCATRRLQLEDRLRLFRQVCAAVEHAHRKGIIHRDIKPSNVLVMDSGDGPRPKVIDFGIAKAIESDPEDRTLFTLAGQVVGTPGYMSPEQAGAEPDIDTRSDIYSLGALLYELLTGTAPFAAGPRHPAAAVEWMRRIRETDPPKPSTRLARMLATAGPGPAPTLTIGRDLDRIVMKALARERDQRYGSASELGEDLRRFLEQEPIAAADPTLAYVCGKFVRRHRWAVATAAVFLLSIAVGTLLVAREARRARAAADRESAATHLALETLSDSYREAGLHEAGNRRPALALPWLERAAAVASHDPERRSANAARTALHAATLPLPVAHVDAPGFHEFATYAVHDSHRWVIQSDWPPRAAVYDLAAERAVPLEGHPPFVKAACFLPGNARVAVAAGGEEVHIHDLETGARVERIPVPGESVTGLWSDEGGRRLLTGGRQVRIWDLDRRAWSRGPLSHPAPVKYARTDPEGRWVLTIDDNSTLRVFAQDDDTGNPLFPPLRHTEVLRTGLILPPRFVGARIAGNFDDRFSLIDPLTGERVGGLDRPATDVSPDGSLVLLSDRMVDLHDGRTVFRRSMGEARFLPDGSGVYVPEPGEFLDLTGTVTGSIPMPRLSSAFSASGTMLVVRTGEGLTAYQIAREEPLTLVPSDVTGRPVFSEDGLHFASAGVNDGFQTRTATRVFDVDTGEAAGPLLDGGSPLMAAAFVSGGDRLVTAHSGKPGKRDGGREDGLAGGCTLVLWDWHRGDRLAPPLVLPSEPRAVVPHPDGSWIAVLCAGGQILRIAPDLSCIEVLHARTPNRVEFGSGAINGHLLFADDGRTLYATGADRVTVALDLAGGGLRFPPIVQPTSAMRVQRRGDVLFLPIAYAPQEWFRDARSGLRLPWPEPEARIDEPFGASLTPDGRALLVSGKRRAVVLDWRSGTILGAPFHPPVIGSPILSVFLPGTPWIATACRADGDSRYRLHVWDPRDGREMLPPMACGFDTPTDLTPSPDGKRLIVSPRGGGYAILDIPRLHAIADGFSHLPPEDRARFAEVVSGYRFINNTPLRIARVEEWLPLWRDLKTRHPGLFPLHLVGSGMLRWHRNREAIADPGGGIREWHRIRGDALAGPRPPGFRSTSPD